jgi:hypothetical protein
MSAGASRAATPTTPCASAERPAFRSRLQTPLPEFAVAEAEIASALRAIDPACRIVLAVPRISRRLWARAQLWFRE